MSTPTPLKRPGEDLVDERGAAKKARTSAPTPSASPPATTTTADTKHRPATPPRSAPQLPGLGMQQGSNSGGGSVTFPTPPSTAGLHGHTMASGAGSEGGDVESEQPTPTESEHRRTDHERKEEEQQPITAPVAPPPAKVLYKLHTEPIPPSIVPGSANLLSLYDLTNVQASVARVDPVTGEKINKLRKHYAGKVKSLGLDGKNKPLKKELELQGLLDPAWDIELPDGRTLWQDQRGDALLETEDDGEMAMAKLDLAFGGIREGQMPKKEHEHWRSELGLDDLPAPTATANALGAAKQPPAPAIGRAPTGTSAFLAKTAPSRNSAPSSPSRLGARPERSGKKRRYDESSYEGYDQEDGYSTGGVDDTGGRRASGGGGKRQKRKVSRLQ